VLLLLLLLLLLRALFPIHAGVLRVAGQRRVTEIKAGMVRRAERPTQEK
jgi:hypothetical protein